MFESIPSRKSATATDRSTRLTAVLASVLITASAIERSVGTHSPYKVDRVTTLFESVRMDSSLE